MADLDDKILPISQPLIDFEDALDRVSDIIHTNILSENSDNSTRQEQSQLENSQHLSTLTSVPLSTSNIDYSQTAGRGAETSVVRNSQHADQRAKNLQTWWFQT